MKRLGLLLLCTALPLSLQVGCDLNDRSIGDSGNADDAGDDGDDGDDGDPTNGGGACTEIGCEDGIFLTLESASNVWGRRRLGGRDRGEQRPLRADV